MLRVECLDRRKKLLGVLDLDLLPYDGRERDGSAARRIGLDSLGPGAVDIFLMVWGPPSPAFPTAPNPNVGRLTPCPGDRP